MKKKLQGIISALMICLLAAGMFQPAVYASEVSGEDAQVQAVIEQLTAIDTLQQIQDNRSKYTVKNAHYDINTTDSAIIAEHETVRAEYEAYVSQMFAARIAAQQAYDALSADQQAQIDAALVAKLDNELPTVWKGGTYAVTPEDSEYTFETVDGGTGFGYEVSNHMVSGNIPQTFVLVDTSDGKTSWTPSGKYVCGESNYDVTYCCDVETMLVRGSNYKRVNLEDSSYYGEEAAKHIRAILETSYPYVTLDEMKANLKAGGLNADFVDSLTRSDIISAVQMAIWSYANAADGAQDGLGYFASIHITKNSGIYFTPLHDTNNECWDWLPGKRQRSFDARAQYRVNNLAYYLCNLPGVEAEEDEIIISDIKVSRADLVPGTDDTYRVGMYVYLNEAGKAGDNLKIKVTSYDADGAVTGKSNVTVNDQSEYQISVKAKYGDTIKVVVEGTQYVGRGVYFYEPEGGRDVSQSLVGVGEGYTKVRAEEEFAFDAESDMGLRIYKTAVDTGLPISDITFDVYKVELAEGESIGEVPTEEEIAKYAVEANKVGSGITDETGYAMIGLDEGTYLVVEQHNTEKVEAPVTPFYITIPMTVEKEVEGSDSETTVEVVDIASVYPKNTPVQPPEEPPIVPPTPDEVKGSFTIVKHDSENVEVVLEGAVFAVYRPVTESDENTEIVEYNGVEYAVVPVLVDGEPLVLTTDENGKASSPELDCGTYFLVETKAPNGYDLLAEAVTVTTTSNLIEEVELTYIANEKGMLLPETGGLGTNGFMMIGGIMMLAAGIFLITKKRMNAYE